MNTRLPIAARISSQLSSPAGPQHSPRRHATSITRVARLLCFALLLGGTIRAQEEPSRLRCTVPENWTQDADGRTLWPPGGDVAVTLAPSTPFNGTAKAWAAETWQSLEREMKLVSGPVTGTHGPFDFQIGVFQRADGANLWVCLHTLVKNGRGETVVSLGGDQAQFQDHLAALSTMLSSATVASADVAEHSGAPASRATNPGVQPRPQPPAPPATFTMHDYEFTPPEKWQVHHPPDHILLSQSPDQTGCVIQILPPQPSSGNLEQDATSMFEMMYPNWGYARSGEQQYILSRGFLPSGLEFCLKEAQRNATDASGRYLLEDGAALVVKNGSQVALIAVRHRSVLAHNECLNRYETWRRFFNSFAIKGAPAAGRETDNTAERIIGVWSQSGGGAIGEYVFAANGHYALSGGIGSSSTSRDDRYEYLHIRTHAWAGDGTYTVSGQELTLRGRGTSGPERMRFRLEQVNHGGTGWKDRLWLLKTDRHGLNEVAYEKRAVR